RRSIRMITHINAFLDRYVLLWPVRLLTNRFIILVTMALLIPLIVWANNTVFVLAVNSYLNTMSVAVSSIVLLYATIAESRGKRMVVLHEQRAQEDQLHVVEMYQILLKLLETQHEQLEDLHVLLAAQHGQPYHRQPLIIPPSLDLKQLHPRGARRFVSSD